MARNEKRRQRTLGRRKHKQKARGNKLARSSIGASPSFHNAREHVKHAREYPVHECLINASWQRSGMASILLSRRQPDGNIVFGDYLVDTLCLGLKSTFCNANLSPRRYEAELKAGAYRTDDPVDCPLPLAHAIIYGGIDYAAGLGFEPDKSFGLSRHVLEERSAFEEVPEVEFGRDGKPLFVSGPHDNMAFVLRKLGKTVGEGNYDFIVGGPT